MQQIFSSNITFFPGAESSLHHAIRQRNYTNAELLLRIFSVINPPWINHRNAMGLTALHIAAEYGYSELIQLLIEFGADIEATDTQFLLRPLHLAAEFGHVESVELLLRAGADIVACDMHGCTPLHSSLLTKVLEDNYYGNREAVRWILLNSGANPFLYSFGWRPIDDPRIAAIYNVIIWTQQLVVERLDNLWRPPSPPSTP